MSLVLEIRSGRVRERSSPEGEWLSAIEKETIEGRVEIHAEGIEGDQHADRVNHGGRDKAILAYCSDHYRLWRIELDRPAFPFGAMGENLDIADQSEAGVCIGDVYSFGSSVLQVSQPRQPCWKPATLHGMPDLARQIAQTGRTGWYLRVLTEGAAEAPSEITLLDRTRPEWTIERANRLIYSASEPHSARRELAALPELSSAWRRMLLK